MVRHVDLKQITHYNLTWDCKCNPVDSISADDVSLTQANMECRHLPKKTLDYIELVPADLKSELDMMFEPAISKGNIFDEEDE